MTVVPKTRREMPVTTLSVPVVGSAGKTGFWRDFRPVWTQLVSPCSYDCPASNRLPQIFEAIRNGKPEEAAKILLETNPFPSITGRICPHFCENNCSRGEYDEAISIRAVERYLGDFILTQKDAKMFVETSAERQKRVAVIGSGPAGLAGAFYLRKMGYTVTVFERESRPGGLLMYGIPPYRLPKQVVEREITTLKKMGVEIKTGATIDKQADLERMKKEFDAVLLSTGAWKERNIGVPGEDYMMHGLEFLKQVNEERRGPPGTSVAVVGGGNTAIDVARTLKRMGAQPVIYYRRTEKEMPAVKEEIAKAKEDGVSFIYLTLPVEVSESKGKVKLKCVRMRLGEPDTSGRRRPIPIEGSEFSVEHDATIKAIGEITDTVWIPRSLLSKEGWINADPGTSAVSDNVFAAGDMVSGPSTVVQAIAAGRKAAVNIDLYLLGKKLGPQAKPEQPVQVGRMNLHYYEPQDRPKLREVPPEERLRSRGKEEDSTITYEEAEREAYRCFSCGYCRACGVCWLFCPDASIDLKEDNKPEFDYDYCKGCGICSTECPCGVIVMQREEE